MRTRRKKQSSRSAKRLKHLIKRQRRSQRRSFPFWRLCFRGRRTRGTARESSTDKRSSTGKRKLGSRRRERSRKKRMRGSEKKRRRRKLRLPLKREKVTKKGKS